MFNHFKIFFSIIFLQLFFNSFAYSLENYRRPSGIFETDSRKWVTETDSLFNLTQSIAIQIPRSRVKNFNEIDPLFYHVSGPTYQSEWMTCDRTSFNEESSIATCTAFLVGKKTLLTAGHCGLVNEAGCKNNIWVFDYTKNSKMISTLKNSDPIYPFEETISKKSTFHCKNILLKGYDQKTGLDFSLIELDREVEGRTPFKFYDWSKGSPLSIFTIGALGGTRLVSVKPEKVVEISPSHVSAPFTLIAKGSGGPVFDHKSKSIVGIAVSSSLDFNYDQNEKCFKEWILKGPWKKTIELPNGSVKKFPYSSAERIDWIHSQTGLLNFIK